MYLIIRNKPDQYGMIAPPKLERIDDFKEARAKFERLTKLGTHVTMMFDHEYRKLYALDAVEGQGENV